MLKMFNSRPSLEAFAYKALSDDYYCFDAEMYTSFALKGNCALIISGNLFSQLRLQDFSK